jgi:hypothetical protein
MEEGMQMEEGLSDTRARVMCARLGHTRPNLEVLQCVMAPWAVATTPEQAQEYYALWKAPMQRYPGQITAFSKERRTVNIRFKDGVCADEVPMEVVKRVLFGDSCLEALLREEQESEPFSSVPRARGRTYMGDMLGITRMTFTASTGAYVPLADRLILTSTWSTVRNGHTLAGVVEDNTTLRAAIGGIDSDMYTRAIW